MPTNPYMINVADLTPGFKGIAQGIMARGQFEREKAKQSANLKMREEAFNLMKEGTPEEIGEYVSKNPGSKKAFDEIIGITNERTRADKSKTSWEILTAPKETIPDLLIKHAEFIDKEGGDAKNTMMTAEKSMIDPSNAIEGAKKYLMSVGDPNIKLFLEEERKTAEATVEAGAPSLLKDFNSEKINEMALTVADTGEYPFSGRSEEVRKANARLKSIAMDINKERGISDVQGRYSIMDRKGMTTDINAQQKKLGSMRSFKKNIDKQVSKLEEVGKRIKTVDNRLLNMAKNKMLEAVGDPDRAVLKLLMGELEEEIGKLASGATESVAALTDAGREKWRKIFDPNLSFSEMMQVVQESKEVAHMRVASIQESLVESKKIRKGTSPYKKSIPDPIKNMDTTPFKNYPVGKKFNTPHGVVEWDGTKLIKVEG